jgi:hypothetical protein
VGDYHLQLGVIGVKEGGGGLHPIEEGAELLRGASTVGSLHGAVACKVEAVLDQRGRRMKREKGRGLVGRLGGQMANGPGKEEKKRKK